MNKTEKDKNEKERNTAFRQELIDAGVIKPKDSAHSSNRRVRGNSSERSTSRNNANETPLQEKSRRSQNHTKMVVLSNGILVPYTDGMSLPPGSSIVRTSEDRNAVRDLDGMRQSNPVVWKSTNSVSTAQTKPVVPKQQPKQNDNGYTARNKPGETPQPLTKNNSRKVKPPSKKQNRRYPAMEAKRKETLRTIRTNSSGTEEEFGIAALERERRRKNIGKQGKKEEKIICRCKIFDKTFDENLKIAVYDVIDASFIKKNISGVSKESPMGKALLSAVANGSNNFVLNGSQYLILEWNITDEEEVAKYKKSLSERNIHVQTLRIEYHDFLIRRNAQGCMRPGHTVKDIMARISVVGTNGISFIDVPASYCPVCGLYYISEKDYETAKRKGTLICQILEEDVYEKLKGKSPFEMAPKSILAMMGYTVDRNRDPGYVVRRQILALIIDDDILPKTKVLGYLDMFVALRDKQTRYDEAVSKWESDRHFVAGYKKGDYKTYGVRLVTETNYHYC